MRRPLLALALVLALAGCGSSARPVPSNFHAETAAALGPNDVWILGEGNKLIRSTDGGAHFASVSFPRLPLAGTVPTVVFANANDGFAYVANGGGLLYATHDGGQSWSASLRGVANAAVGGGHVFAITPGHGLESSPVGADTWTELPSVSPGQAKQTSIAVEGSRVWLLGPPRRKPDYDTIQVSSDSGRTFTSFPGPCYFDLGGSLVPSGGSDAWAVCPSGLEASLLRSTDGGRTFHAAGGPQPPPLSNSAQIFALTRDSAVLWVGVGAPLYRTTDSGKTWRRATVPWTQQYPPSSLAFATGTVGYAVASTKVWRTADAGRSWHALTLP